MSLSDEQSDFTKDVAQLICHGSSKNIKMMLKEGYRHPKLQEYYYSIGKTKTKNSLHMVGLAVDFDFKINNKICYEPVLLATLGEFWETIDEHNEWGGYWDFLDVRHFERRRKPRKKRVHGA